MADHKDYDGIKYREESSSPLIFRLLFGGLVIWGGIFMGYYLFSGWSSDGELQQKKKDKAEQVAAAMVAAIRNPRPEVWPWWPAGWVLGAGTLFPRLMDRLMYRYFDAVMRHNGLGKR